VHIYDSYASPGEEQALFPGATHWLSRDQVLDAWDTGVITSGCFMYRGHRWRLHSCCSAGSPALARYLAVYDPDIPYTLPLPQPQQQPHSEQLQRHLRPLELPQRALTPASDGPQRSYSLRSRALTDVDDGGCSVHGTDVGAARCQSPSPSTSPRVFGRSLPLNSTPRSLTASGTWLGSTKAHVHAVHHAAQRDCGSKGTPCGGQLSAASAPNKFIEDLLVAEGSHNAMERYKALVRLMSSLRRRIVAAHIAQPTRPASWDGPQGADLLKQVVLVGECLARFGTAEFTERSNTSRAINTKDYASLLTQFLEAHGPIFTMEFIMQLSPQSLQDEVLTVRSLLQTRCDANSILFGQLVKHVGLEGTGNGQAVVYNTSVVTANPTSFATAHPRTWVQAASGAWAKASHKTRTQLGAVAAVAGVAIGAWVTRRAARGRRRGRCNSEDSDHGSAARSRRGDPTGSMRGTPPGAGGPLGLAERLLSSRAGSERAAVATIATCEAALSAAARNVELLEDDWRLGRGLRLGGGRHPAGYARVDTSSCSLSGYLQRVQQHDHLGPSYGAHAYDPAHSYATMPPPMQVIAMTSPTHAMALEGGTTEQRHGSTVPSGIAAGQTMVTAQMQKLAEMQKAVMAGVVGTPPPASSNNATEPSQRP